MKPNLKTLAIATCLALGTCAYAQEGFVRPEFSYNYAKTSNSATTGVDLRQSLGYGLAGGAYLGEQNQHEIGLSVALTDFSPQSNMAGYSMAGKVKTLPVMANYRYYAGAKADAMRFYVAPSLGLTKIRTDITTTGTGYRSHVLTTESDLTWGAGLGILVKLKEKIDADVGYRYTQVNQNKTKVNISSLYAGVNFRF